MSKTYDDSIKQEAIKLKNSGLSNNEIYAKFPKIPRGTIYCWFKYNNPDKPHISTLKKATTTPLFKGYEKVKLEEKPIVKAAVVKAKSKIMLVCSDDPQAILDVLKGMN